LKFLNVLFGVHCLINILFLPGCAGPKKEMDFSPGFFKYLESINETVDSNANYVIFSAYSCPGCVDHSLNAILKSKNKIDNKTILITSRLNALPEIISAQFEVLADNEEKFLWLDIEMGDVTLIKCRKGKIINHKKFNPGNIDSLYYYLSLD
jgi:hypothetical protein